MRAGQTRRRASLRANPPAHLVTRTPPSPRRDVRHPAAQSLDELEDRLRRNPGDQHQVSRPPSAGRRSESRPAGAPHESRNCEKVSGRDSGGRSGALPLDQAPKYRQCCHHRPRLRGNIMSPRGMRMPLDRLYEGRKTPLLLVYEEGVTMSIRGRSRAAEVRLESAGGAEKKRARGRGVLHGGPKHKRLSRLLSRLGKKAAIAAPCF